jgi:hypothetical protein
VRSSPHQRPLRQRQSHQSHQSHQFLYPLVLWPQSRQQRLPF